MCEASCMVLVGVEAAPRRENMVSLAATPRSYHVDELNLKTLISFLTVLHRIICKGGKSCNRIMERQ